jgi:hypothetical protein
MRPRDVLLVQLATMVLLETPSRIWRRIEAVEGDSMPSLPSLPHFDSSSSAELDPQSTHDASRLDVTSRPQSSYTPFTPMQHLPPIQDESEDDLVTPPPVTPHSRRRSFLLDVINSNVRPRMRFPTPHPRRVSDNTTANSAYETNTSTPSSHDLTPHPQANTPSCESNPVSFISTASSHDLTIHPRVNTSFDPVVMGMGGPGVGRFNAGKLNTYLHGLNRRLQEENEGLLERLRRLEEGIESERAREKERWKERMGEVEKGVEGIVKEIETKAEDAKRKVLKVEEERRDKVTELQEQIVMMQDDARNVDDELQLTKDYAAALEADAGAAEERIEHLENQLMNEQRNVQEMDAAAKHANERLKALEVDAQRAADLARQMEEALETAEKKMRSDEDEIAALKGRLSTLELHKEHSKLSADRPLGVNSPEADLQEMEDELDKANKEIARLNALLRQSPARRAMDKAKDARIEILEREKETLTERIKSLKNHNNTPSKLINASGISPIHRQVLSMSIRPPRTPGAPLRDVSGTASWCLI